MDSVTRQQKALAWITVAVSMGDQKFLTDEFLALRTVVEKLDNRCYRDNHLVICRCGNCDVLKVYYDGAAERVTS